MATMRELKGRINSVHSSQKITGAMKMISSARLRKAENKLLQAEPYRRKLWEIYAHIEKSGCEFQSPLTVKRQVKKVAIVIFASDDGLCGAFNINLYKKLVEEVQAYQKRGIREITVFPVGKKILAEVKRIKGIRLARHPEAFEKKDYMAATRELADELMEDLEQIRQRGYSIDNREDNEAVFCVGAPILNQSRDCMGAISISAIYTSITDERLSFFSQLITSSALGLSHKFGYSGVCLYPTPSYGINIGR